MSSVKMDHPNAGEVMVLGHLHARGIHVPRAKIRNAFAIHHLDPLGPTEHRRPPIRRWVYSVPCPNYIWHIDGNHKLIRWRLVVHHGIDGFSRLVVFANCSDNNRSETVLPPYQEGIRKYGRPYRVRTDHGGENVLIWRDMVAAWGEEAKPVLVGSSVHNQRIERHNRALNEQEIATFKKDFYSLESEGVLDPLNDTDLFCLHYVYIARINRNLAEFVAAHNNHPLSTEHNNSPAQLFWTRLQLTALKGEMPANRAWQGVDVSDFLSVQEDLPHVQMPHTRNLLDDETYPALQQTINPLGQGDYKTILLTSCSIRRLNV